MKAGLVQMFHALASLRALDGVCVLVNGDEELGSPTSTELVTEAARSCAAAFVLEASADPYGALKTARKGTSRYEVVVHGRAAHAGLEPEKGVNAAVELAHQILAIADLAVGSSDPLLGAPTITPTLLSAGSSQNSVPALATVAVDVRVPTRETQDRIDDLIRHLPTHLPGARVTVEGGPRRPPMEPASSAGLFALAAEIATDLGQAPLQGRAVGGASDGNYTAGVGCPTLDGLGGVGSGAHADTEHVLVGQMVARTELLAGLVERTRQAGGPS
jgi:glutamate carboxypeptidase